MTETVRRGADTFGWQSKLRKADEFSSVFHFRHAQRGELVDILYRPNGLDFPRLGLVVPKKVLHLAVDRNRTKRVLRELFRCSQRDLAGLDLVIRFKAPGLDARLREDWATFLRTQKSRPASA